MARFKAQAGPMHKQHEALTKAFMTAENNTTKDGAGNARYDFTKTGMPRSPAQMQAVKKAAATSAAARSARADVKLDKATPGAGQVKATSTGGLGLVSKKKGLLGM